MNFGAIFLTGLTTGGLSCLAVQGGLLATSLARRTPSPQTTETNLTTTALPVLYFLLAKLFAYTVLGALLGAVGSAFQITPTIQAIMMLLAGLFMLATALNMFNVHPIFRYAALQPPKALTRLVRNQAKSQDAFAPIMLGLMTIFIPCGTTQAMEVMAVASANLLRGALIMFVFVLGTTPTFFILGFVATQAQGRLSRVMTAASAVLILFLGVMSIDGGLNLLGSPLAPSHIVTSVLAANMPQALIHEEAVSVDGVQDVTIEATANGYVPNHIMAVSDQPLRIHLVTHENYSCTNTFVIPSLGIKKLLTVTGEDIVDVPAQPSGTLSFTCGMGMYSGTIELS